jgi:hypothetical protein
MFWSGCEQNDGFWLALKCKAQVPVRGVRFRRASKWNRVTRTGRINVMQQRGSTKKIILGCEVRRKVYIRKVAMKVTKWRQNQLVIT